MELDKSSRVSRVWKPLTLASSLLWMTLVPAAAVFAQSGPAGAGVTLTASGTTASVGMPVTFTASAPGVASAEYQFWVEEPTGQWVDAQNYSASDTFTLTPSADGDYLVAVDVLTAGQVAAGDWSAVATTLADGVFVGSQVGVTASVASVSAGGSVTLTATAANIYDPLYQFWVESPSGTWTQSGAYSSANTYTFSTTTSGAYRYVAYAKSPLAANDPAGALPSPVGLVTAWGTPAAVTVTAASPTLLADGTTTDALTVTVTDGRGTPIPTFDGWIKLTGSGPVTLPDGYYGSQATTSGYWFPVTNGSATVDVTSNATGAVTVTPDDLINGASSLDGEGGLSGAPTVANVQYTGASYTAVAADATVLTLSAAPTTLPVDPTPYASTVTVGLTDGGGASVSAGPGPAYVTLTLTGPGSFSATSSQTSETVQIPAGASSTTVSVWDELGMPGTIAVSATGSGLVSPPALDIPTEDVSAPAGLTLTASQQSGQTMYTVSVVDAAGQVLTEGAASSSVVTVTDNTLSLGDPALDYAYGPNLSETAKSPKTLTGTAFTTGLTAGQATFAVSNSGIGKTAPTITVTDASLGFSASALYRYTVGTATQAAFTTTREGVQTGSLAPGQSITVTGQLEDAAGNAVQIANQPIWFKILNAADAPAYGYYNPYGSSSTGNIGEGSEHVAPQVLTAEEVGGMSTTATPIQAYHAMELEGYLPNLANAYSSSGANVDVNGIVTLPSGSSNVGDEYEAFTNSQGQASITVSVPATDGAYDAFQLGVAVSAYGQNPSNSISGTWSRSPVYAVVPAQYQVSSIQMGWIGVGFDHGLSLSAPFGDGRVSAGEGLALVSEFNNPLGQSLGLSDKSDFGTVSGTANVFDEWLITSSNPNIVNVPLKLTPTQVSGFEDFAGAIDVNTGITRVPGTQNEWLVSPWQMLTTSLPFDSGANLVGAVTSGVGTAALTLQDVSNPGMPSVTTTVTTVPSEPAKYPALQVNGSDISVTNPLTLTANQPQELMVVNQDLAGTPVPVTANESNSWTLPPLPSGEQWDNQAGAPINSVSIPVGATSAPVWLVSDANVKLGGVGLVEHFYSLPTDVLYYSPFLPAIVEVENSWDEPLPETTVYAEGSGTMNGVSLSSNSFQPVVSNNYGFLYNWNFGDGGEVANEPESNAPVHLHFPFSR